MTRGECPECGGVVESRREVQRIYGSGSWPRAVVENNPEVTHVCPRCRLARTEGSA